MKPYGPDNLRSRANVQTTLDKWKKDILANHSARIVGNEDVILEAMRAHVGSIRFFETEFQHIDAVDGFTQCAKVGHVLSGYTKIWRNEDERQPNKQKKIGPDNPRTYADVKTKLDEWKKTIRDKYSAIVLGDEVAMIESMRVHPKCLLYFQAEFQHVNAVDGFTQRTSFDHVLSGNTTIWRHEGEHKQHKQAVGLKHNPRGVFTSGNKERSRFDLFLELMPGVKDLFEFDLTKDGCLADVVATMKSNGIKIFMQLATAIEGKRGQFDFAKNVAEVYKCINLDYIVILTGISRVDPSKILGVYVILPDEKTKAELLALPDEQRFNPSMTSNRTLTTSIVKFLQPRRYLATQFNETNVKGEFGTFADMRRVLVEYMIAMATNKESKPTNTTTDIVFVGVHHCTEYAGDQFYKQSFQDRHQLMYTNNKGERGDGRLWNIDTDHKIDLMDERKTLLVDNRNSNRTWALGLRQPGQPGNDPRKVNTVHAIVRRDRSHAYPSDKSDFIGVIPFPILTDKGELALRPNKLAARTLSMSFDVDSRQRTVRIRKGLVADGAFPESLCSVDKLNPSFVLYDIVFYENDDDERRQVYLNLLEMFSNRQPTNNAIVQYEMAVSDKLIDDEKKVIRDRLDARRVENTT